MHLFKQWEANICKSAYHTCFDNKVFYDTEKDMW